MTDNTPATRRRTVPLTAAYNGGREPTAAEIIAHDPWIAARVNKRKMAVVDVVGEIVDVPLVDGRVVRVGVQNPHVIQTAIFCLDDLEHLAKCADDGVVEVVGRREAV